MKVAELLERAQNPIVSFEIIPPPRGGSLDQILSSVEDLMEFEPPFIDVTSHSAQVYYEERADGTWRRHVKRKRPGTLGICASIQSRFGVPAVPHMLCQGFTREETEDALIELNYLGIRNVMALRGDDTGFRKQISGDRTRNEYAVDLVRQIAAMNSGHYLEDLVDARPTEFCIGVAGYPEKHFEAPNLSWDVLNLKRKIDAGAHFVTGQMCFDNAHYLSFVDRCREVGIEVPIVPGIKILTTRKQIQVLPSRFHVDIPEALAAEVEAARDDQVAAIGIEWATRQCAELFSAGIPYAHFYIMQNTTHVREVMRALRRMA